MPTHVVCYYLDGHVHGNEAKALRGFADSDGKTLVKDKQALYISNTEESLKKVGVAHAALTMLTR